MVAVLSFLAIGSGEVLAQGNGRGGPLRAQLTGLQEVPAILTPAHGSFEARVTNDGAVDYRLTYSGFASNVAMAHIHIGQPGVSGGIAVSLCGGGGAPACPSPSGTVEDTFIADDVQAIAGQGLAADDLAALLRAIRDGVAYVNVHSATFGNGEIRGQIRRGGRGGGNNGGGNNGGGNNDDDD
jgi:hypothetical protein